MTATPMMIQGEMPIHAALPVCFLLLSPENAPLKCCIHCLVTKNKYPPALPEDTYYHKKTEALLHSYPKDETTS